MPDSSRDPKERFSSRVDAYVAARPRYPQQIIDHLNREIGLTPDWHVVDLGSGTGISCELFLANGNPVTGVEPNAAMRSAAESSLRAFAKFRSIDGSAEATTIPDVSTDLVFAAQAFHWFDIPVARRETLRILRPGGWALMMWNNRQMGGTPFLEGYEQLLISLNTDYLKVRHNNIADEHLRQFFGVAGWRTATFPNRQHLDWEGLRARVLSSSYVPQDDPRVIERLREIFDRHNQQGRVTIEYQTELFYGQPSYNSESNQPMSFSQQRGAPRDETSINHQAVIGHVFHRDADGSRASQRSWRERDAVIVQRQAPGDDAARTISLRIPPPPWRAAQFRRAGRFRAADVRVARKIEDPVDHDDARAGRGLRR